MIANLAAVAALAFQPLPNARQVETADLRADARLDRLISLREITASLETVTQELSKALSIPIAVSAEIRDRKATILFKNRKGSDAMNAISTAFMLKWRKENLGYRLQLSDEARALEKQQLQFEFVKNRTALSAWTKRLSQYSDLTNLEIQEMVREDRARLKGETIGLTIAQRDEIKQKVSEIGNPIMVAIASVLGAGKSSLVDAILRGEFAYASSDPADGWLPLRTSLLLGISAEVATSGHARIRFDPLRNALIGDVIQRSESFDDGFAFPHILPLDGDPLNKGPLEKVMEDWNQTEDSSVLGKAIDSADKHFPNPGYRSSLVSLSEHLAYLSDTTGVDIISDAYRQAVPAVGPHKCKDISAYLSFLSRPYPQSDQAFAAFGYAKTKDGWLMVRHKRFWNVQQVEIPERILAPLEKKLQTTGIGELDDYAAIAAQLDPRSHPLFTFNFTTLFRFSGMPFRQCLGSLVLWANLSRSQKQKAQSEEGLNLGELSQGQTPIAWKTLSDLMWTNTVPQATTHLLIAGKLDPSSIVLLLKRDQKPLAHDTDFIPLPDAANMSTLVPGTHVQFIFLVGDSKTKLTCGAWLDKRK